MTQTERLVNFLRRNPGSTSLQITMVCGIVNTTGRISDARKQGVDIVCVKEDGLSRYYVKGAPIDPTVGEQLAWTR